MALIQGVTNALSSPAATPDGTQTPLALRTGKYNEQYIGSLFPTKVAAALAGYYYSVVAAGTAVVTSLTALTEASPALIIENTAQAGGPNIMLDFMRIKATAIAAASTDWQVAWKLDNIRNKWASAGSTLTPQNASMGSTNSSVAAVHFGALVVSTAQQSSSNARSIVNNFIYPTTTAPATIIGDTVDFRFGSLETPLPTVLNNVAQTDATHLGARTFATGLPVALPPVILTPGTTATLFLWSSNSASAPSYELNGGWYEY